MVDAGGTGTPPADTSVVGTAEERALRRGASCSGQICRHGLQGGCGKRALQMAVLEHSVGVDAWRLPWLGQGCGEGRQGR